MTFPSTQTPATEKHLESEMEPQMTKSTLPPPIASLLSEKIDARLGSGMTLQEIASEIGYSPKMIDRWKSGELKVPLDKVPQIAAVLEAEPRKLFRLALAQYWRADEATLDLVLGPG